MSTASTDSSAAVRSESLRQTAERLDDDPLSAAREGFLLPEGLVYLDGNSLGALPAAVPPRLDAAVIQQWGGHLIGAWNDDGWWTAPLRIGDRIGRLLGAAPGQTVLGESTSVQIFNALTAAARLRPDRRVILTDVDHFPTDRYLATSVGRMLGLEVVEVPVGGIPQVLRQRGGDVAVVALGAVDYRTGELWDVRALTAAAHEAGAVVLWDLCHAVGAVELRVDADGVDLAVGCTYKYLSGGPGAPAFIYVAARHQGAFDPAVTGWHGHARPFDMAAAYEPATGVSRARVGTPPVLSMLALEAALDTFDGVTMGAVRARSLSLTGFLIRCADELLAGAGFEVVTPREPARRGSHVSLRHAEAHPLMAALIERGVVGDVRPPNLLRFGCNALYVSHADVLRAMRTLRDIAADGGHRAMRFQVRGAVS